MDKLLMKQLFIESCLLDSRTNNYYIDDITLVEILQEILPFTNRYELYNYVYIIVVFTTFILYP